MKKLRKILICFLALLLITNVPFPSSTTAATSKYGVILGDKANTYQLSSDLTVMSPANNIMVKAYDVCKSLGLSYHYNSTSTKLTIKNPNNGKSLIFVLGSKNYKYYSSKTAAGVTKTATYPFYYDSASKSNVIHASTLKYLLQYNYYKDITDTYYAPMGYRGLVVYSMNGYSSYDIPITDGVIKYINAKTFTSKEELLDAVRMNMLARNSEFTLTTTKGVRDDIGSSNKLLDDILSIDKTITSKDADYLSLLVDSLNQRWSWSTKTITRNGITEVVETADDPATLTIQVQYETTLTQERVVDSKIASILKKLKLTNASDYEKVKAIHDYVINLASYDTSYQKSSLYDILVNKSSVCEGYALAAYRLFTDAGLDCRIITGTGDGEAHAWNIVKVEDQWYNIDLTWDDPTTDTGAQLLRYDYFLKNEADFTEHVRGTEYRTNDFLSAYPIATESYE